MFSPGADLAAIAPVRPYRPDRGRWLVKALTVLRTANEPLGARAIARRIMAADGIPATDFKRLKSIECGLHSVLAGMEGHGLTRTSARPKRWAIAGEDRD